MIEMRTVIVSFWISDIICLIAMALLWHQNRRHFDGLGFWLADYMLQAAALFLVTLRGTLPDAISIVISNAFVIGGTIILLIGLERFAGLRSSQIHNYILLTVFLLIHSYFTFNQPSLLYRNINLSVGLILVCSQCAWLLFRRVDSTLQPITRGTGYIFLAFCLAAAGRIVLDLAVGDPSNDLFSSNIIDTLAVLTNQMLFIILTFGLILMANRHMEQMLQVRSASLTERVKELNCIYELSSLVETPGISLDEILQWSVRLLSAAMQYPDIACAKLTVGDRSFETQNHQDTAWKIMCDVRNSGKTLGVVEVCYLGNRHPSGGNPFLREEEKLLRAVAEKLGQIIERRRIEDALRLSEEKYFKAFHASPDAIVISRASDGKFLEVNDGFVRLTGYSRSEALESSSTDLGIWKNSEDRASLLDTLEKQHGVHDHEYQIKTKSGRTLFGLYSGEVMEIDGEANILAIIRDITERKQTELELKKLSLAVEQSQVSVIITDPAGAIEYVNPKFCQATGYSFDEVRGRNPRMLRPVGASPEVYKQLWATITSGKVWRGEFHNQKKNGDLFWESTIISPITNENGVITHYLAVKEDITERKQMEVALLYRNEVLATLHQVTLDLVNRHEVHEVLQTLLLRISSLLDAPQVSIDLIEDEQVLVTRAATPNQPLQVGDRMQRGQGGWLSWQALDTGQPAILEDYATWSRRRDLFEGFPIHAVMVLPIQQSDRVVGAINISRSEANQPFSETDIYVANLLAEMVALVLNNVQLYTQLKTELAERIQNEEYLRQVQQELVDQKSNMAVFDERQRVARDLHDSVSQSIHSLVLFSETLGAVIEKKRNERAEQVVTRLQESARQALKETRLMLYELQTETTDRNVDLVRDLEARLATVEHRAGVEARLSVEGAVELIPGEWRQSLFWIIMEALNNSLKHAQARKVQIKIRCSAKGVEILVTDNGKGFDPAKPSVGGMGLQNMHDRAADLGGKLFIESNPQKGTSIRFKAEIRE